jgi:hypothetical protein
VERIGPGGEDMKKWTWEWLALLGPTGMIFLGVDWVWSELITPQICCDEYAIRVYHEPLYYDHYFLMEVEKERLRMEESMGHRA